MFENIDPSKAHELLSSDGGYAYVDVRTEGEFQAGHPEGAVNIPAFIRDASGQMGPNPEFAWTRINATGLTRKLPVQTCRP